MPTGRLSMRRIRDVLRLKYAQGLDELNMRVMRGYGVTARLPPPA